MLERTLQASGIIDAVSTHQLGLVLSFANSSMTLASGTRLGPYEIIALLGAGGMGEVYRARDTALGRDVAVKVLSGALETAASQSRFDREARALAALNHPHIATLYAVETLTNTRALVMELVEGDTLADRLARGRITAHEALTIARQIADAHRSRACARASCTAT